MEIYDIIQKIVYTYFFFADSDNSTIESVTPEVLGNISVLSIAEDASRDRAVITTEDFLNTSLIIFSAIAGVLFIANIALIIVDKHCKRI